MANPDASSQEQRHLDTTTAHVLNLGNLIYNFSCRVEHEVGKHKIHHWPCPTHRRAASQADKTALANWRIAQPLRSIGFEQADCRGKISAPPSDSFAQHEDFGIVCKFLCKGFRRCLCEGEYSV